MSKLRIEFVPDGRAVSGTMDSTAQELIERIRAEPEIDGDDHDRLVAISSLARVSRVAFDEAISRVIYSGARVQMNSKYGLLRVTPVNH